MSLSVHHCDHPTAIAVPHSTVVELERATDHRAKGDAVLGSSTHPKGTSFAETQRSI